MTSTELKRFAQTSHIPAGSVTAHIATRHSKTLATAPVGRTRSTTRDAQGRFTPTDWTRFLFRSEEFLTQARIESLIEAIKNIRRRSKERRWVGLSEKVLNAAAVPAFQEAAAIASRLVAKATRKRLRHHKTAFANHIVGLEEVANEVHTDATRYGTVTILLQAAGPGLAVPKTGTPADANADLVDVEQNVGEAVYLAPNVPHIIPCKKRENARISLVFFF